MAGTPLAQEKGAKSEFLDRGGADYGAMDTHRTDRVLNLLRIRGHQMNTLAENASVADLYRKYYRVQCLPDGSDKTDFQYEVQFRHFDRWLGRTAVLADLSDQTLGAFLVEHRKKRCARTVNKAFYCLTKIWKYAADLRLVDKRPTLRCFPEPDRIPRAWLLEELQRLLQTCAAQNGDIDGLPAGKWWLALHWVWWSTGERRSAALQIKSANVCLARAEVSVEAEVRKGRRRDMLYRLLPQAVNAIRDIYDPQRTLLFPWPYCEGTFYHHYTRILRAAGLPDDRYSKPQRMRRSFASHLEAAGGNATEALGHSTRSVTKRAYLDPRICGRQDYAQMLPDLGFVAKLESGCK